MKSKNLYKRVKDENITNVAKDLYHQIGVKGHTSHEIIGTHRAILYMYGFDFKDAELPSNITYEQFKQEHLELFEGHMRTLQKCIDAGFKI